MLLYNIIGKGEILIEVLANILGFVVAPALFIVVLRLVHTANTRFERDLQELRQKGFVDEDTFRRMMAARFHSQHPNTIVQGMPYQQSAPPQAPPAPSPVAQPYMPPAPSPVAQPYAPPVAMAGPMPGMAQPPVYTQSPPPYGQPAPVAASVPAPPPAKPVRAPLTPEELLKRKEEQRSRNVTVLLLLAVFFVLIAGMYLATSSWMLLSSVMKSSLIGLVSLLFFGVSILTDKKIKIPKTAFAFWMLGSLFVPITLIAFGYYGLFGQFLSLFGDGRSILCAMIAAVTAGLSFYNTKKYQNSLLALLGYVFCFTAQLFVIDALAVPDSGIALTHGVFALCWMAVGWVISSKRAGKLKESLLLRYYSVFSHVTLIWAIFSILFLRVFGWNTAFVELGHSQADWMMTLAFCLLTITFAGSAYFCPDRKREKVRSAFGVFYGLGLVVTTLVTGLQAASVWLPDQLYVAPAIVTVLFCLIVFLGANLAGGYATYLRDGACAGFGLFVLMLFWYPPEALSIACAAGLMIAFLLLAIRCQQKQSALFGLMAFGVAMVQLQRYYDSRIFSGPICFTAVALVLLTIYFAAERSEKYLGVLRTPARDLSIAAGWLGMGWSALRLHDGSNWCFELAIISLVTLLAHANAIAGIQKRAGRIALYVAALFPAWWYLLDGFFFDQVYIGGVYVAAAALALLLIRLLANRAKNKDRLWPFLRVADVMLVAGAVIGFIRIYTSDTIQWPWLLLPMVGAAVLLALCGLWEMDKNSGQFRGSAGCAYMIGFAVYLFGVAFGVCEIFPAVSFTVSFAVLTVGYCLGGMLFPVHFGRSTFRIASYVALVFYLLASFDTAFVNALALACPVVIMAVLAFCAIRQQQRIEAALSCLMLIASFYQGYRLLRLYVSPGYYTWFVHFALAGVVLAALYWVATRRNHLGLFTLPTKISSLAVSWLTLLAAFWAVMDSGPGPQDFTLICCGLGTLAISTFSAVSSRHTAEKWALHMAAPLGAILLLRDTALAKAVGGWAFDPRFAAMTLLFIVVALYLVIREKSRPADMAYRIWGGVCALQVLIFGGHWAVFWAPLAFAAGLCYVELRRPWRYSEWLVSAWILGGAVSLVRLLSALAHSLSLGAVWERQPLPLVAFIILAGVIWAGGQWAKRLFPSGVFFAFGAFLAALWQSSPSLVLPELLFLVVVMGLFYVALRRTGFDLGTAVPLLFVLLLFPNVAACLAAMAGYPATAVVSALVAAAVLTAAAQIFYPKLYAAAPEDQASLYGVKLPVFDWLSVAALGFVIQAARYATFVFCDTYPFYPVAFLAAAAIVFLAGRRTPAGLIGRILMTVAALLGYGSWYTLMRWLSVPSIIETELTLLPLLPLSILLGIWVWNKAKAFRIINLCVMCVLFLVLALDAIITGYFTDAVIISTLSLLAVCFGFILRKRYYFIFGVVTLILCSLYHSREFWGSLAWWVYLLIIAAILFAIAINRELSKNKEKSQSIHKLLDQMREWD